MLASSPVLHNLALTCAVLLTLMTWPEETNPPHSFRDTRALCLEYAALSTNVWITTGCSGILSQHPPWCHVHTGHRNSEFLFNQHFQCMWRKRALSLQPSSMNSRLFSPDNVEVFSQLNLSNVSILIFTFTFVYYWPFLYVFLINIISHPFSHYTVAVIM